MRNRVTLITSHVCVPPVCIFFYPRSVSMFNVQGSVHRNYIPFDIFPTGCNITQFIYFWKTALHVSGVISTHHQEHTQLFLQYLILVKPLLLPAAIVEEFVPPHPGYRPATSSVHYTTSCNTQSSAPEDGRNHRPKYVELTGIINKPLLLHLVGCLHYTVHLFSSRSEVTSVNF